MNLLPKSHKKFSEKDYWNSFFENRKKSFDWYGDYLELCAQLHKYIKHKDEILVPGCGNSTLSSDLYDAGYTKITNIDSSEIVIKQMNMKNKNREQMKYLVMDALNTSYNNDSFNVVLDKGTLDALMPDDTKEIQENIDKYFNEIKRLLKNNGRYLCISLLQEHILRKIVNSFESNWAIRIIRCHDAELKYAESRNSNALPVFCFIATKFIKLPLQILELCLIGEKIERVKNVDELISSIKSVQEAAMVTNGIVKNSLVNDNEVVFDLTRPGESIPRFTVYILDQLQHDLSNKYAAFIVPQGRELEWMFSTVEGRKELLSSAKFGRLLIVTMHRDHKYDDLDSVKNELADTAKTFAPYNFRGQIPFLSIGSDVGKREIVHKGNSDVSGDYVIEDVDVEGETFRRLIFLNNQFLIQSEAKLKLVKTKIETRNAVDPGYLACSHHTYMIVGVDLSQRRDPKGKISVIGLGGGGLTLFLHKCYEDLLIKAVDIDEAMLEIATRYFDLKVEKNLEVVIEDGLEFIKSEADRGEHYNAILFDVDSKDRSLSLSCPPKEFLEENVLDNISKLISTDGIFILNIVCRDTQLRTELIEKIKSFFKQFVLFKVEQEVNEIIFCSNSDASFVSSMLEEAIRSVNSIAKSKKITKKNCIDLDVMMKSININK